MSVDTHDGVKPTPATTDVEATVLQGNENHDANLVTATEEENLQRGLHERHLSMLGIAGAIGTGLFLGLGQSVQTGGPLGALLGYATIGLVVCAVQFALGEVAALLPVTGAFVRHAEFLVDPAWGFAIGWNLVYGNVLSIPSEITAICVLFEFWTDLNPTVWIVIFILLTTVVGLCFVRIFGEVEFWFALLKILLVSLYKNLPKYAKLLLTCSKGRLPHHFGLGHQLGRYPWDRAHWIQVLEEPWTFR